MSWLEPVSTAVTAANLANELRATKHAFRNTLLRGLNRALHGAVTLPIFGAGGVGKTTTGNFLVGGTDENNLDSYASSWCIESLKLNDKIPGKILVAPGQQDRAERYWPELIEKANKQATMGLINVVCNGLHSFGIKRFSEHDLWESGMSAKDFIQVYSIARRAEEIEMLDRLLSSLVPTRKKYFFLTLVTKQDLWWNERNGVKAHYSEGEYGQRIDQFRSKVGAHNFQHEFLPVSLTLSNLSSPSGELLKSTVAGYDHSIHLQHLSCMFENVGTLLEGHLGKK